MARRWRWARWWKRTPGREAGESEDHAMAAAAALAAVREAEAVLDEMMEQVVDRRSREDISRAIEAYVHTHGEPRFRMACYRCQQTLVDVPLVYPSARGLWSWLPPAYLLARFNDDADARRCQACGTHTPPVHLAAE